MPRLTLYLLKLATDTDALDEYRKHRDNKGTVNLQAYLTASEPGLTREQADAIASLDSARIQEAVSKELHAESSFAGASRGFSIQFDFEVNHIQGGQGGHPPPTPTA